MSAVETDGVFHSLDNNDQSTSPIFSQTVNADATYSSSSASSLPSSGPNSCLDAYIEPTFSLKTSNEKTPTEWNDVKFIAISGKRSCGKDFFAEMLQTVIENSMGRSAAIVHIADQIKRAYCDSRILDMQKIMSSPALVDKYYRHVVRWSEQIRRRDPHIFCRKALEYLIQDTTFKPSVVIVADCRRASDLAYFDNLNESDPMIHIRVSASLRTRISRGFIYRTGIDDAETECALDDAPFDVLVVNESERTLQLSMKMVRRALSEYPLKKLNV